MHQLFQKTKEVRCLMRSKFIIITIVLAILFSMLLAACGSKGGSNATQPSGTTSGGTIDGATLLNTRCNKCHTLDRITSAHKTADEWNVTVTRMISNGAQLTPQEEQVLIAYLAKTYGP